MEKHTPSQVTSSLVQQLLERDKHGQVKYGTSLDRADLTPEQWAQHAVEELLDGAGYLTSLQRELAVMREALKRKDRYIRAFIAYFEQAKAITPTFIAEANKELE
jgi:hypothetical protein